MSAAVDRKQIVYALERQAEALERRAIELMNQMDYDAMFPEEDAERLREAIVLIEGMRPALPIKTDPNIACSGLAQRHGWALLHDLVAHPLMALTFYSRASLRIHDFTSHRAWPRKGSA